MNLNDELENMISQVTSQIGKPITSQNYKIVDRGIPHNPDNLPDGKWQFICLFLEIRY